MSDIRIIIIILDQLAGKQRIEQTRTEDFEDMKETQTLTVSQFYKLIKSQKNRNASLQCIQNKTPYIRPCQWELYLEGVAGFY